MARRRHVLCGPRPARHCRLCLRWRCHLPRHFNAGPTAKTDRNFKTSRNSSLTLSGYVDESDSNVSSKRLSLLHQVGAVLPRYCCRSFLFLGMSTWSWKTSLSKTVSSPIRSITSVSSRSAAIDPGMTILFWRCMRSTLPTTAIQAASQDSVFKIRPVSK